MKLRLISEFTHPGQIDQALDKYLENPSEEVLQEILDQIYQRLRQPTRDVYQLIDKLLTTIHTAFYEVGHGEYPSDLAHGLSSLRIQLHNTIVRLVGAPPQPSHFKIAGNDAPGSKKIARFLEGVSALHAAHAGLGLTPDSIMQHLTNSFTPETAAYLAKQVSAVNDEITAVLEYFEYVAQRLQYLQQQASELF